MDPLLLSLAALIGYLLGALSFARLVARFAAPQEDLSQTTLEIPGKAIKIEMTSVSATTVMMRTGPKFGCLTSLLDMAKVSAPTLFFWWLHPGETYFLVAAAAGVAGHNFPLYYGFKGGRGVSPIFGGLFIIDWLSIPVTVLASNVIGLGLFRNVLIAYTAFTVLLIPWMWFRFYDLAYVAYAVAVTLLFYLAMVPELKQYYHLWRAGELEGVDLEETMGTTHMKYILKFGQRLGLLKAKPDQNRAGGSP